MANVIRSAQTITPLRPSPQLQITLLIKASSGKRTCHR